MKFSNLRICIHHPKPYVKKNLGGKQTILLHDCLIKDEGYDLVLTPQRQTIGYIRSKKQTQKITIIATQKQIKKRKFSKTPNAILESVTTTLQRQTIGYIRSKKQTQKITIIATQKQIKNMKIFKNT